MHFNGKQNSLTGPVITGSFEKQAPRPLRWPVAIEACPEPWNAWLTGFWWRLEGQSPTKWISEITETIGSRHKITSALGQENDSSDLKTVPILKSNNTIYYLKSKRHLLTEHFLDLSVLTHDGTLYGSRRPIALDRVLTWWKKILQGIRGSVHKTIPQPPSGVTCWMYPNLNGLFCSLLIWFKYLV